MRLLSTCAGLLLAAPLALPAQGPPETSSDPLTFVKNGNAQNAKGNFNKALDSFNKALELNPGDSAAYEGRGETHLDEGDMADAISDFSRALKIEPDNEPALFHRGMAEAHQGAWAAAVADFNQAMPLTHLAPTDAPLILVERGRANYFQGDDKGAVTDLSQALALNTRLASAFRLRGLAEDDQGNYDDDAADFASAARNGDPFGALWYWEAKMEGRHNDDANGTMPGLLAAALAKHPDPWISELGNLLLQQTTETQIQADAPNGKPGGNRPAEASFFIGLAREYSGDTAGAKQAYQQITLLGDATSVYTIEAARHLKKLSP
jgi:tetratricopeptide (TPR) repeat protein